MPFEMWVPHSVWTWEKSIRKGVSTFRARQARSALSDLPELRNSHIGQLANDGQLDHFLDLVEGLDGLPRDIAMHPCGVVLSDAPLLDRTPWRAVPRAIT